MLPYPVHGYMLPQENPGVARGRSWGPSARRASLALEGAQIGGTAQRAHLRQDLLVPLEQVMRGQIRVKQVRVRQHGREQRRLRGAQVQRRGVPEALCRRLHPVDAVAELGDVQVDLQDALLGPQGLDEYGEVRLEPLADEAWPGPQKQVLRHLLRDGARAAQPFAMLAGAYRLADRVEIEAGV